MDDLRYVSLPPALASIKERTTEIQFSMASEPLVGAMLRVLVASKPNGRFLELGTGTGIATAWLLSGMDAGSTLVSVDNDSAVQQVAKNSLGADGRLTLVTLGGLEYVRDPSL
jgi:predicted O-methyltransferase YrrM